MRASLDFFSLSHSKTDIAFFILLVLHIYGWSALIALFIGLHVTTKIQLYQQNSENALLP